MEPDTQHTSQPQEQVIQLQLPGVSTNPRPATNVQLLIQANKDFVTQGNKAEEKVALQIILVSSAILAIISGVGISNNDTSYIVPSAVLLVLAVLSFGAALTAGVVHFISERYFWYSNWAKSTDALKLIGSIADEHSREAAAYTALSLSRTGSNRAAFVTMIIAFLSGVIALLVIITAAIITNTK